MKISECNHIRIRDNNQYGMNVEQFIKSIEDQYKIDFRSLYGWKELVKRLHVMTTDGKRKIQDANLRKFLIINKLNTQFYRNSPFVLTDQLARTSRKWQMMEKLEEKSRKSALKSISSMGMSATAVELEGEQEISNSSYTVHPNTEIIEHEVTVTEPLHKSDAMTETKAIDEVSSHLPVNICTNQHRRLSSLRSQDLIPNIEPTASVVTTVTEKESKELMVLKETFSATCYPKIICIDKNIPEEQSKTITISNRTIEYMYIRFACVADETHFKKVNVLPVIPKKICPGLSLSFKFYFKLVGNIENFTSALCFKIGRKVVDEFPEESLRVPIVGNFDICRSVSITETVIIPPVYLWQLRYDHGFPLAVVDIKVNDNYSYHLHISQRAINITQECQDSFVSVNAASLDTESLIERTQDKEIAVQSKMIVTVKEAREEKISSLDIVAFIVDDLVELSLETFVFENAYLNLKPMARKKVNVYFAKPSCIGSHHCYYDFTFYDLETEEIVLTKTIKIFSEVLPHPIKISPTLLDMSKLPIWHGMYQDHFVIMNTHKLYPVTIKIKLTTKMKKLFRLRPMETVIPTTSSVQFEVIVCSREAEEQNLEDLAFFTFKIIVIGNKTIYDNVPPFFYELILPCAKTFRNLYNEKYF
jgi:hypothetical protein